MDTYKSAADLVRDLKPERPVLGFRPKAARRAASWFLKHFPGPVLYAVKANNHPLILDSLYRAGVRHFDVASLPEIQALQRFEGARLYLMNPVNSRQTIAASYFDYGIRDFTVDCEAELLKILQETGYARDLNIYVRIKVPDDGAVFTLNGKFGVDWNNDPDLLLSARQFADRLALTFHVGSQSMDPTQYAAALAGLDRLIVQTGVLPDIIDVGGGFPALYPGLEPPPLHDYLSQIESSFEDLSVVETCTLQCQPGRALVAEAGSLIVRVECRRGNSLYINDGAYGALFDGAHFGLVFPAQIISDRGDQAGDLLPFQLYGPTCDSIDVIKGPFLLPDSIGEGDYIELGQLGAYGAVMRSNFNGFGQYDEVTFLDEPFASLYGDDDLAPLRNLGVADDDERVSR